MLFLFLLAAALYVCYAKISQSDRDTIWGRDDEPQYQHGIQVLHNVSNIQEDLFIEDWTNNSERPDDRCYIICYAHDGFVSYYLASNNGSTAEQDWHTFKKGDIHEQDDHEGLNRRALGVADIRLYRIGVEMRMTYVFYCDTNFQCQGSSTLFYNAPEEILYTIRDAHHFNIEHEMGRRQQKNWSPFAFVRIVL
jgi:hypothetical protein